MVVRWTDIAEERLKNIFDYYLDIAGDNAAVKIISKIVDSADLLGTMPYMASEEKYLSGQKFVYRSLVVSKLFKIIYFVDEKLECVVISTIWDCRCDPLKLQEEIAKQRL